ATTIHGPSSENVVYTSYLPCAAPDSLSAMYRPTLIAMRTSTVRRSVEVWPGYCFRAGNVGGDGTCIGGWLILG
ncbi:MAG: hypothetical protein ABGY43_15920, partial [bacterium]